MNALDQLKKKVGKQITKKKKKENVATLALGLRPRQKGCKGAGQEEAKESHHILSGV